MNNNLKHDNVIDLALSKVKRHRFKLIDASKHANGDETYQIGVFGGTTNKVVQVMFRAGRLWSIRGMIHEFDALRKNTVYNTFAWRQPITLPRQLDDLVDLISKAALTTVYGNIEN